MSLFFGGHRDEEEEDDEDYDDEDDYVLEDDEEDDVPARPVFKRRAREPREEAPKAEKPARKRRPKYEEEYEQYKGARAARGVQTPPHCPAPRDRAESVRSLRRVGERANAQVEAKRQSDVAELTGQTPTVSARPAYKPYTAQAAPRQQAAPAPAPVRPGDSGSLRHRREKRRPQSRRRRAKTNSRWTISLTSSSNGRKYCNNSCGGERRQGRRSPCAQYRLPDARRRPAPDGDGAVLLGGKAVKKNYKCAAGDRFEVLLPEAEETELVAQDIPLDVVYEDGDVIVVNKPRGMVVHPHQGIPTGRL